MLDFGFYNMDCMEGMKEFPDKYFDLAIVDPPYRDENAPMQNMRKNEKFSKNRMRDFGNKPNTDYFRELFRISKNQIIWGGNNFELPTHKGFIVWDKCINDGMNFSQAEYAYLSEGLGTLSKIYRLRASGCEQKIHPTQKPVALYKWILTMYANKGDKILDTHVGSASSLIACYDMGFKYVGFEIDAEYYKLACQRLEEEKAQMRWLLLP